MPLKMSIIFRVNSTCLCTNSDQMQRSVEANLRNELRPKVETNQKEVGLMGLGVN